MNINSETNDNITKPKPFRSYDEQIQILKDHNLIIEDETEARDFLLKNNYYRLKGYFSPHQENNMFLPNVTFHFLVEIYNFDRCLRSLLMNYIEIAEVTVKTAYSNKFAEIHGPTDYYNPIHFSDTSTQKKILDILEAKIEIQKPYEKYIFHYTDELHQALPIWAIMDLLSIGNLQALYDATEPGVQRLVAEELGFFFNFAESTLNNLLNNLRILRNRCAHNSRLYARLFRQQPTVPKTAYQFMLKDKAGNPENHYLFGFFFVVGRFLTQEQFSDMFYDLLRIHSTYPTVNLKYYGIPDNFQEVVPTIIEMGPHLKNKPKQKP